MRSPNREKNAHTGVYLYWIASFLRLIRVYFKNNLPLHFSLFYIVTPQNACFIRFLIQTLLWASADWFITRDDRGCNKRRRKTILHLQIHYPTIHFPNRLSNSGIGRAGEDDEGSSLCQLLLGERPLLDRQSAIHTHIHTYT